MMGASLLLMHVANGWVARNYERLNLADSDEIKADRAYLASVTEALKAEGFEVDHVLAMGEPSDEIVKFTRKHKVDLIAMSTHGHRFISDLLYGSTADKVRHLVDVPVLLLKATL
jgi:nucleotide-binding universal stress UspA family protein